MLYAQENLRGRSPAPQKNKNKTQQQQQQKTASFSGMLKRRFDVEGFQLLVTEHFYCRRRVCFALLF